MGKKSKHFYEFGSFRLDAGERVLLRDGNPVPLTPKDFEMLLALVENSGHVLGKDELMKRVWPDSFVEEANLSHHVFTLRKSLGDDKNGSKYIETVPRRGYRFVASVSQTREECADPPAESHPQTQAAHKEKGTGVIVADAEPETAEGKTPTPRVKPLIQGGIGKPIIWLVLAALVTVGLGVAAYFWLVSRAEGGGTAAPKSIAVLPFKPLASGGRDESLELGMADTLITRLGAMRAIIVRPMGGVRKYASLGQDSAEAGRALGVEAVLDGSIQHAGERVRVTVRLVRVADGQQLWADKFDEKFTDIFSVQDAISERVARSLALRLTGEEGRRLAKRDTGNAEAYLLYLKGRYFWNKRDPESTRKSIEYFEQAIAIDPDYALAYSGLADAYRSLSYYDPAGGTELLPRSKKAALKALAIDDTLAEAHTSLGAAKELYEWDFPGAESEYKRAIELNPNNAVAHHRYGVFLTRMGRIEGAHAELGRALELDPLSLPINADAAGPFVQSRDYDRAIGQYRKTIEIDPSFPRAHGLLALCYAQAGRYDEAIAEVRQVAALNAPPQQAGGPPQVSYLLAYVYAKAGRVQEARQALDELERSPDRRDSLPYYHALAYAALGERERAFALMEKLYEIRSPELIGLRYDLAWEDLRGDPRFQDFLRRVGLGP